MSGALPLAVRPVALLVAVTFALGACTPKPKPKGPTNNDPDAHSGPDAIRTGALQLPLDQDVPDDVSYKRGDRTDWKFVDLVEEHGKISVFLTWDDKSSELELALFDTQGDQLIDAPKTPGQQKTIELSPLDPGRYYVRVLAPEVSDESSYVIKATWTYIPPEQPEAAEGGKDAFKPDGPKTAEKGLLGRIVTAYMEEGALTLLIDKGSADGVKAGTTGVVLDGPVGYGTVKGASVRIVKVAGEHKSVGKCRIKNINRAYRVSLRVK